jgi:ABC-type spermidine/putrescine transport system permease subunit I
MFSSVRGFWPAAPALILLLVFFLFPVVRMLGFSVEGGTLDWYAKALGEGLYVRVFWNTFEIALLVTFFCLLLGYPLGFLMATTTPFWATLGFIFVLLPLWTSVLVRTYAWMVLLGRNGVFNRTLIDAGIITDPIPLLHNFTGVMIGMVHVLLPYMVLPALNWPFAAALSAVLLVATFAVYALAQRFTRPQETA